MNKPLHVLTIGGAVQDIYLHYQGADCMKLMESGDERSYMLFESGAKVEVDNVLYHTGGGSTNSAVSFKRQGFAVSCFCMIGNDQAGKAVLQELETEGVDTDKIIVSKKHASGTSFVVNSLRRDRTIFAYRGANGFLSPSDVPLKLIQRADQLYITSLSHKSSKILKTVVEHAKKHNVPVAINPGISQLSTGAQELKDSLAFIDTLILNSSEAKTFMAALITSDERYQKKFESGVGSELCDPVEVSSQESGALGPRSQDASLLKMPMFHKNLYFSITNFFKEVMKMGPRIVVVTDGARGVYVATKNTVFFHPSLSVDIVDTLGAGDAFGSCFVGCLGRGMSIEESLKSGIVNSASVIGYLGAKPGLLASAVLEKRVCSLHPDMLQRYEM